MGVCYEGSYAGFCLTVSIFFSHPQIHHIAYIILFVLLTSIVFSLGGFMNALFARNLMMWPSSDVCPDAVDLFGRRFLFHP